MYCIVYSVRFLSITLYSKYRSPISNVPRIYIKGNILLVTSHEAYYHGDISESMNPNKSFMIRYTIRQTTNSFQNSKIISNNNHQSNKIQIDIE